MRISVRFLNIGTPKQAKREKFKVEIVNVKQMCYSFVFYKWKGFEKTSHCTFVVHRCICTYNFDCHMCACLSVCNAVVRVSTKWNLLPLNANREKKNTAFRMPWMCVSSSKCRKSKNWTKTKKKKIYFWSLNRVALENEEKRNQSVWIMNDSLITLDLTNRLSVLSNNWQRQPTDKKLILSAQFRWPSSHCLRALHSLNSIGKRESERELFICECCVIYSSYSGFSSVWRLWRDSLWLSSLHKQILFLSL